MKADCNFGVLSQNFHLFQARMLYLFNFSWEFIINNLFLLKLKSGQIIPDSQVSDLIHNGQGCHQYILSQYFLKIHLNQFLTHSLKMFVVSFHLKRPSLYAVISETYFINSVHLLFTSLKC